MSFFGEVHKHVSRLACFHECHDTSVATVLGPPKAWGLVDTAHEPPVNAFENAINAKKEKMVSIKSTL
jgi:hypothetical protein